MHGTGCFRPVTDDAVINAGAQLCAERGLCSPKGPAGHRSGEFRVSYHCPGRCAQSLERQRVSGLLAYVCSTRILLPRRWEND